MNVEITSNRWTCVSRMSVEQESMTKNIDRHVWHSTRTKTDNMRREDSSTPVETFKRVERSMAVAPAKQIPKDATKLVGWRAQSRRCDDNSRPRASFTGPFTQRALTAQTCSHQETARFVGNYVVEPRGKSTDQGSNPHFSCNRNATNRPTDVQHRDESCGQQQRRRKGSQVQRHQVEDEEESVHDGGTDVRGDRAGK